MTGLEATSIADAYWATFFGLPRETLFAVPFRLIAHAGELGDYHGVYGLFRRNCAIVSAPPERLGALRLLLESPVPRDSPIRLAELLITEAASIVGPAFIGYAIEFPVPLHACRSLGENDAAALHALRSACGPTEWEHGGSGIDQVCSGIFVDRQLAAVAGYEVWGGSIAHISVVSDPRHRGRGYGRSVVAHLAARALSSGLLPQYRTLEANESSMRVAESLGFQKYAVSMAVRLK